jgi:hypothetical protein
VLRARRAGAGLGTSRIPVRSAEADGDAEGLDARADVPVSVALQSDNVTQVTIYRVGQLGTFAERSLDLVPGSYTVVGTRPGYRDVRREINVRPGAAAEPGRDPLRGSHLSGLVVRESLGERRFAATDFPIAVGGTGSAIVMAGDRRARSVYRHARGSAVRAARRRAEILHNGVRVQRSTWLRAAMS